MNGTIRAGQKIHFMHTGIDHQVEEVGLLKLKKVKQPELTAGDVGYVIAGIKSVSDINIGDTVTDAVRPAA